MEEDKRGYAELRTLLEICIEDIRYSKKQQWNTIYLTLVALGALISLKISFPYKFSELAIRILLTIIAVFVSFSGMLFIKNYSDNIEKFRNRKIQIRNRLHFHNQDFLSDGSSYQNSADTKYFTGTFWAFIFFGLIISIIVIWS